MVEQKKEEPMQMIPIRKCSHYFIMELMQMVPQPATETVDCYCAQCYIDKVNEICYKLGIKPLKPCGLFDLKKGPLNPETGRPIGEWVFNE
jgi:hypothetical protein